MFSGVRTFVYEKQIQWEHLMGCIEWDAVLCKIVHLIHSHTQRHTFQPVTDREMSS